MHAFAEYDLTDMAPCLFTINWPTIPSLTKKQYNTLSGSVTFPCTPAADRSQKYRSGSEKALGSESAARKAGKRTDLNHFILQAYGLDVEE